MSKNDKPLVLIGVLFIVLLFANLLVSGGVIKAAFVQNESCVLSSLVSSIHSWQSLIAGALALLALPVTAILSIRQIAPSYWEQAQKEIEALDIERNKVLGALSKIADERDLAIDIAQRQAEGGYFGNPLNIGSYIAGLVQGLQHQRVNMSKNFSYKYGGVSYDQKRQKLLSAVEQSIEELIELRRNVDDELFRGLTSANTWKRHDATLDHPNSEIYWSSFLEKVRITSQRISQAKNDYINETDARIRHLKKRYFFG